MNKKGTVSNLTKNKGRLKNLTPEERKIIGRKGGLKTQENIREQKSMQTLARMIINCKPNKEIEEQIHKIFPEIEKNEINNSFLMIAKIFEKAVKQKDVRAFEVLRDTAGYKPVDKNSLTDSEGNNLEAPMIVINPVKPKKKTN